MLNLDGEVVGINTAIASRSGGNQGIGFAVPSNMAKRVMEQLVENGAVVRGWLGVVIQDLNEELVEALDLEQPNGVLVTEVAKGSPANQARLLAGDVVTRLEDTDLANVRELRTAVAQTPPGTTVSLTLLRDGLKIQKTVEIGIFPGDQKAQKRRSKPKAQKSEVGLKRLGVKLANLTASKRRPLTRLLGIRSGDCFVETRSPVETAGLRKGDAGELNRKGVQTPSDVNRIVEKLDSGATFA